MQTSQTITARSASNLAGAFILLPKKKRLAMCALYAFCREVDDVADEEESPAAERRARLQAWREDVRVACGAGSPRFPVNRELQPVILAHKLPFNLFDELIKGVEMDLDIQRYETLEQLEQYCYRVASVVGLLSIEIFGYQDAGCQEYARHLGKALQLTNILRDVRTDAAKGRIYLPLQELQRFGVSPEEILRSQYSPRYLAAARSIAAVAREYYVKARQALPAVDRRSMTTAELMGSVYWRLLEKLERNEFNVFHTPETRLTKPQKVFLIFRTWFRIWSGGLVPNYGLVRKC